LSLPGTPYSKPGRDKPCPYYRIRRAGDATPLELDFPSAASEGEMQPRLSTAYLGLGSNLGDRAANLLRAVTSLVGSDLRLSAASSIYETEPIEVEDQPYFLNMVVAVTAPRLEPFSAAVVARRLQEICVGQEWSFGKNRAGNLALLKELGAQLDFTVVGVEPVTSKGTIVSSTAIRKAVELGDFETAKRMLGRDYTILGTVEEGKHLGRSLGFPTANLSAHSEQFPPNGVYAAEGMLSGKTLRGVVNLGVRPTIGDGLPQRVLEFHVFDVDRDLYGEDVELRFLHYLRPERKFESLAALREQIARDVSQARKIFAESAPIRST